MYAKVDNNIVTEVFNLKEKYNNVSFPNNGPSQEWLEENNLYSVTVFKQHDRNTEKLVSCEPYFENNQVFLVTVQQLTEEEINSKNESITLEINNLAEGSLKLAQYDNAEKNRVSRKEFFFFLSNISRILSNETIVRYDYKHDIGVTKFNIIYNSQNEKILSELQEYILRNGKVSNLKNTVVIVEGKTFQYSLTGDFNER